jgi:hypothetical protein
VTTINGFPVPSFETITPVGLYILLMLLFFFGKVVPIGRLRDEQKISEYWREVSEKKQDTIDKLVESNGVLTKEVGATVEKVMASIQAKAGVDQ